MPIELAETTSADNKLLDLTPAIDVYSFQWAKVNKFVERFEFIAVDFYTTRLALLVQPTSMYIVLNVVISILSALVRCSVRPPLQMFCRQCPRHLQNR